MALEIKLVCNVEIVLSADEAVRSQMKFWNDNHTLMYFNMVVKNYHLFSVIRVSFIDVINYSTVRVRPTLSDITAIRSPVLATFLANRYDNTKQMVCSYRGYYCGLSIRLREFDSPTDRQIFSYSSVGRAFDC